MADKGGDRTTAFSLKDHLFNEDTLGQLAAEYATGLPGFDAEAFLDRVMPGLASGAGYWSGSTGSRIAWSRIWPGISRPWPISWRRRCPAARPHAHRR
jgi:hypothetical protein